MNKYEKPPFGVAFSFGSAFPGRHRVAAGTAIRLFDTVMPVFDADLDLYEIGTIFGRDLSPKVHAPIFYLPRVLPYDAALYGVCPVFPPVRGAAGTAALFTRSSRRRPADEPSRQLPAPV